MPVQRRAWWRRWPRHGRPAPGSGALRGAVLAGVRPVRRAAVPGDVLAGITLAAIGVPEVLGYARIAGMPVVTGLYTLLLPMAAFAVLGASRHLVVGADSATAVILAGALVKLAAPGSASYVRLAGLAALLTGGLLLLARLARLGFLSDFLSRTVLLGFLTGVGIQVAVGQLPDMLGITATSSHTLVRFGQTVAALPQAHPATAVTAAAVIGVMLAARRLAPKVPGALIAVLGAIIVSWLAGLAGHGVAVLGPVPRGLPRLAVPALNRRDATALLGPAASMFVVILAQSAATARAYAAKYGEPFRTDADLIGLAAANIAAAFSGTFVVNGSPTKTQVVDGAGGRSQLAQLSTSVVVLLVLAFATGPLQYLPIAALAAVVFLIGAELIDLPGMRRILAVRRDEFTVALITAAAVVVLGVQDGIVVAVIASTIDHLRHSYRPRSSVLVKSVAGHWRPAPVLPGARSAPGLVVYRFGSSLYYANAARFAEDMRALTTEGSPLRWVVLDGAAIGDVDYTAASVLRILVSELRKRGIRLAVSNLLDPVQQQLARYGISGAAGPHEYYDTPGEALEAFLRSGQDGGAAGNDPVPPPDPGSG